MSAKSHRGKSTIIFHDFFNNGLTRTLAVIVASGLLIFSPFISAARGQGVFQIESDNATDPVMRFKDNLRSAGHIKADNSPILTSPLPSSHLLSPSAGDIDLSFNPVMASYVGSVRSSAIQSDGKLVVGGFFISINGIAKYNLARFNLDGTLDSSFSPKVSDGVYSVLLQPDGKILIGGAFAFVNGISRNRVARLNPDGSLDLGFDPAGGPDNTVYRLALQPDGKIMVGGFFTVFDDTTSGNIARLHANGTLDGTFSANTNSSVYSIVPLTNGKYLVGGTFTAVNGVARASFARLNSNGTLDTSLTTIFSGSLREIVLQPDGKVLVGGNLVTVNAVSRNRIARLNADLSLDTSFNPGTGFNGLVWSINLLTSGKMIVGGEFTTFNGVSRGRIAGLNTDGTLDVTLNPGTGFDLGSVYTTKILPSGQIGVGGFFTKYNGVNRDIAAVLETDGTLDPNFALSTLFQANVRAAVTQFDGKVVVGGNFNRIYGQACGNIARLNVDGTLDTSFNSGSGANGQIYTIAYRGDGKIFIGGSFTTYNGVSRNRIARLNADGTLDTAFNPGTGADSAVSIIVDAGAGVYIGGSFTSYNGTSRPGIAKLNDDGSINTNFNPASIPLGSYIEGIAYQNYIGKLVVGGQFIAGTYNSLIRLNLDGTVDNTFTPATAPNTGIFSLAIQDVNFPQFPPNEKILIGGTFSSVGGVARNGIARLNANGTSDTSFNVGIGTSIGDDVEDIFIDNNGRIVIAGLINSINGAPRSNIARLNTNGSLDTTFTASADNIIWDIEPFSYQCSGGQGKLYISGDFFTVNDTPRTGFARLFIEPGYSRTRYDFDGDGKTDYGVFRPSDRTWYLQQSTQGFTAAQFGLSTDKLVPDDYDRDGKTDIAVFRDGIWYLLRSSAGFTSVRWGQPGDIPLGSDDDAGLVIYRPSTNLWYSLNPVTGTYRITQWGLNGDIPIPFADYSNGPYSSLQKAGVNNGCVANSSKLGADHYITVFRPSNGVWYTLNEDSGETRYVQWGQSGDIPVAGDYDGDGISDAAIFRNGVWWIRQSSNNQARSVQWGLANDKPVQGDYDGDGKTDIAVWRPSDGSFYVLKSNGAQFSAFRFGSSGDTPVASAYTP
jgi:uncharacterized delta-60 repeat protein